MSALPLPLYLNHAILYVALATVFLFVLVLINPRLMLQDYPPAIKEVVPPKTLAEKRLSTWLGLDWLVFCTITPKWFIIPGSEGHPAYKDYFFHFRGFLIGTVFSAVLGLIAAGIVTIL